MTTGKALDGKPYAGNPHVRFDEGEVASAATPRRGSLLYSKYDGNSTIRMIVLATAFAAAMPLMADTETVGGIEWNYTVSGGKAALNSYCINQSTTGKITIPSTLGGYPVTSVEWCAFYGCSGLTNVVIGSSVTSIGDGAFSGCSGLTSVTIPDSVTSIGNSAFAYCSGLTSVTIPNSVTNIGWRAFDGCSGLTSVTIPDSVTSIGEQTFHNCIGLTAVTIGNGVTSIGVRAFSGCSSLRRVTIPDSVTSIGVDAFAYCSGLTSVTIGNGVTNISSSAFTSCSKLASVTISDSVTSIGSSAFWSCSKLASMTIPDSVASIGEQTFYKCSGLTNVVIGSGVTNIGNSAFYECSGLTSVTIPNGVTSIASQAFEGCSRLTNVVIGSGVKSIGNYAFRSCSGLTGVYITDLAKWCCISFSGSSANPLFYAHNLYLNGEKVTDLTISDSVTYIASYAFSGCTNLTSVTIPNSVMTYIASYAFYDCSRLNLVLVPRSMEGEIPSSAFYYCASDLRILYYDGNIGELSWLTLTFDANGGEVALPSLNVLKGQTIGNLPVPSHTNYGFVGWFTGAENGELITSDTVVNDDVTLYAHWMRVATSALNGTIGAAFNVVLQADGGRAPYTWELLDDYTETRETSSFSSSSGTAQGWQDDDSCWTYKLPFAFPFYGKIYTTAYINSNGTIAFDRNFSGRSESLATLKTRPMIAVLWDDLKTTSGNVYVTASSDSVTFRWAGTYYSGGSSVNFAATLSADGTIRLSYGAGNASGGLIGISPGDGTNALVSASSQSGSMARARDIVFAVPPSLPEGLEFREDGTIVGIPLTIGTNTIRVVVTDANGTLAESDVTIAISEVVFQALLDADAATVTNAIEAAGLADAEAVKDAIGGNAANYNQFVSWAKGVAGGEAAVVASTNAAVSYLLGAERLFVKLPRIEIGEVSVGEHGTQGTGGTEGTETAIGVTVIVKDGEEAVKCATEKVKEMFEATSDLGDWDGTAKLEPAVTVVDGDGATMRFKVTPGDGTAAKAFLRVKVK